MKLEYVNISEWIKRNNITLKLTFFINFNSQNDFIDVFNV